MVVIPLASLLCCATACNTPLGYGKSEKHFVDWNLEAHDLGPRCSWAELGVAVCKYLQQVSKQPKQRQSGSWSCCGRADRCVASSAFPRVNTVAMIRFESMEHADSSIEM